MDDLIKEYRESLSLIREARGRYPAAGEREQEEEEDYRLLGNMERELQFILKWLTTGREPGGHRGAERLAAYQREVPCDPLWFQEEEYLNRPLYLPAEGKDLPEPAHFRLEWAMSTLSSREKEVFKMSRGEGFTSEEIGEMLGIAAGAVRTMIHRAEEKIAKEKESSLFLIG